jgi:pimeloyl-ACP methyl ester carboxylesterase
MESTMIEKHIEIDGINGRKITIDYRFKESTELLTPIVYVHGFKGFKDWGSSNIIANNFAENGFLYIKFNFSHNGVTIENLIDFTDLEAFGNNNYWIEFRDLGLVIDWLEQADLKIDFSKLSVIGHSRGGGIALLRAAQDKRIYKAITWASVCDFEGRFPKDTSDWKAKGVEYIYNGRTEQMMPLYFQLYESYYKHQSALDILVQCTSIEQEVLVIHGTNDSAVDLKEAKRIVSKVRYSKLEIIENAGHTFGAVHPAKDKIIHPHLNKVLELSLEFLAKNR